MILYYLLKHIILILIIVKYKLSNNNTLIFLYLEILNEIMLFMKTYNIDINYKHNINQTK